jgi:hypothetical protein
MRVGKIVFEGSLLIPKVAEMGKQFLPQPTFGVETQPGQQIGGLARMLPNVGQGLVLLTEF